MWIDAQLTSLKEAILSDVGGAVYGTLVVCQSRRSERMYNSFGGATRRIAWEKRLSHLDCVSMSSSQYGNGRAKLQKTFAFCEKFEGNWVALRRSERIAS